MNRPNDAEWDEWLFLNEISRDRGFSAQDTMEALEKIIGARTGDMEAAKSDRGSRSEEWRELLRAEAHEDIESLIGIALVVQQVRMTSSIGIARALARNRSSPLSIADCLSVGRRTPSRSLFVAEGVWQLANYFKHRDTWDDWDSGARLQLLTVEAIRKLGCSEEREANLSIGLAGLGLERFTIIFSTLPEPIPLDDKPLISLELAVSDWQRELESYVGSRFLIGRPRSTSTDSGAWPR